MKTGKLAIHNHARTNHANVVLALKRALEEGEKREYTGVLVILTDQDGQAVTFEAGTMSKPQEHVYHTHSAMLNRLLGQEE